MAPAKMLIVIAGPTGIGKTALAITLAKKFETEIVSADSRQFFKEMSIGTAKPSPEELLAAPHYFIDSHSIHDFFSTGDFEVQALHQLEEIFSRKNVAIMVGGSGLYLDAVTKGLDVLPDTDMQIRETLNKRFQEEGLDGIRAELAAADPEYFERIDQFNPQRMIRGLEFYLSTGTKVSGYLTNTKKARPFRMMKIGLNMERSKLYERINHRVDLMVESGLVDEVSSLAEYCDLNALKTVGYAEIFRYLDGLCSLDEAIALIKQNTRRFAKRQLTWFRRDPEISWFEPGQDELVFQLINDQLQAD